MTKKERRRWQRAARLARLAMGKSGGARGHPPAWHADLDPLAWWCLTDAIYST